LPEKPVQIIRAYFYTYFSEDWQFETKDKFVSS